MPTLTTAALCAEGEAMAEAVATGKPLEKRRRQEALGQFLTPAPVGDFMASLVSSLPPTVRFLDAGAGGGALTAALVRRVCKEGLGVRTLHATAYEIDGAILPSLRRTMKDCAALCEARGIGFTFAIHHGDFIGEMAGGLAGDLFSTEPPSFDLAIANPPYKKINADSPERLALRSVGLETSNLYAGFVGLLARLLGDGGQLVAITPRSFCNGPYFRPFREDFLRLMELERLHVFESRQSLFREDAVLQENIVFHARKGSRQPRVVTVSSSSGETEGGIASKRLPFAEIVHPKDPERFIHIPADTDHASAKAALNGLPASLASLGLNVSTGRVVDFRLSDALRPAPMPGAVPLLYPCHFHRGAVQWPKTDTRKPNAILDNEETRPWLVPAGIYLLTKRFTSKEERRRLVACLFDPAETEVERIGFENHLNYFHASGQGLERTLALGLFVFLNSTPVDHYFRCFSGHTQVNATDLRKLPYPDAATLRAMGRELKGLDASQEELDRIADRHLHDQ